jgi:E3 ubiquitin-protein ligase RNF14
MQHMHVKEGTLFQLVCPDAKCNTSIPHYLLKRLLNEEEFERWDRLALEKALDSMADVVYCPKCVIACVEDEDNTAQCPQCSFTFCGFCKELWHPGKQCLTPEQKLQRRKVKCHQNIFPVSIRWKLGVNSFFINHMSFILCYCTVTGVRQDD